MDSRRVESFFPTLMGSGPHASLEDTRPRMRCNGTQEGSDRRPPRRDPSEAGYPGDGPEELGRPLTRCDSPTLNGTVGSCRSHWSVGVHDPQRGLMSDTSVTLSFLVKRLCPSVNPSVSKTLGYLNTQVTTETHREPILLLRDPTYFYKSSKKPFDQGITVRRFLFF